MKVLYEVRNIPRRDGCDVFINSIDGFIPERFNTEEEAIDFISKQFPYEYTITKIYVVKPTVDLNNFAVRTNNRSPLFDSFMDYLKREDVEAVNGFMFKNVRWIGKKNGEIIGSSAYPWANVFTYEELKEQHPEIFQ